MSTKIFCQSCSMPLTDPELSGTEKNGSSSSDYCKYCYKDGEFVNPTMSLKEMRSLVVEKMEEQNVPEDIIEAAVLRLPSLKRWKKPQKLKDS